MDDSSDIRLSPEDDASEFAWLMRRHEKKRFYSRDPKHGSKLINQLMARKGYGQTNKAAGLQQFWQDAVGESLAGKSQAGAIKGKRLEVTVENSSVMQELTFQKRKILKKLQASLNNDGLSDLRFKVGPLG